MNQQNKGTRPIWAEISRSRLLSNFKKLQAAACPHASLMAVVKADAYGHAVNLCAPWLAEAGAEWLGVTSVEEGVSVRKLCSQARILVMCGIWPGEADAVLEHGLVPTVWTEQHIDLLAKAAQRRHAADHSIPVHLEIDTGMSRQGVGLEELPAILDRIRATPALHLDGVFTHFASPEMLDSPQNDAQQRCFAEALQRVAAAGFHPTWIHAGNSSTLLAQDRLASLSALAQQYGARFLVRPGLALYGYASPFVQANGAQARQMPVMLEPVLRWKTRIAALRTVEAGTAVGYGATFVAAQTMRLALLPVGYADGLNRRLSNCGSVLVRGHRAAIIGRVSMDLTVVDVSAIPDAAVEDEVALIGEQSGEQIGVQRGAQGGGNEGPASSVHVTAEDHARWAGTVSYEILCAISVRVARVGVE